MKIGKLRKATGFWRSLSFMGNVSKMRRALLAYFEEEGIQGKVDDGLVVFEFDECVFYADFEVREGYAECTLHYSGTSESYESLDKDSKAFIADKVNIEQENHTVAYAYNDRFALKTYFFFTNKEMMFDLFRLHFLELTESLNLTNEIMGDFIEEYQARNHKVGFHTSTKDVEKQKADKHKVTANLTL